MSSATPQQGIEGSVKACQTAQSIKASPMLSKVYWLQAIKRAHNDVKPGLLQVNAGELLNANANRSPTAYLANPPEERARYQHNTDKTMTLLKVLDTEERQVPVIAVCRVYYMEHAY